MKILFLAPRYHTNQVSMVEYFLSQGCEVAFWVTRIGVSEDYSLVRPHRVRFFAANIMAKIARHPSLYDVAYRNGIPSLEDVRAFIARRFNVVIIRNPITVMGFVFTLLAVLTAAKIVFYTQREMYVGKVTTKDRLVSAWTRLFRAVWVTPCLGDDRAGRAITGMYYLPFAIPARQVDRSEVATYPIQIISVGKFVARKNHLLLLKALERLQRRHSFELTLVGEHSEATGNEYFELVAQCASQVAFPVRIKKNIERSHVFELYGRSHMFVLASRDEPASVSNLEAMSFGLPVITSSTNQTSCYTKDNGLVFESDSLDSLTAALDSMLSDREALAAMGNLSLTVVQENHDPEKVYGTFLERIGR